MQAGQSSHEIQRIFSLASVFLFLLWLHFLGLFKHLKHAYLSFSLYEQKQEQKLWFIILLYI